MKDFTWSRGKRLVRRESFGLQDRAARQLVQNHLRKHQGGSLTFVDPQGEWRAGPPNSTVGCRVEVHDPRFYSRIVLGGTLGAAESYLDGHWECDDLVMFFRTFLRDQELTMNTDRRFALVKGALARITHFINSNTRRGSRKNIRAHYDLGNEFFSLFLDETMTYSCAIFPTENSPLEEAQRVKLDRICEKLAIRSTDRVLEIGGGWGSFARLAAQKYGCEVVTTTISPAQASFQRERLDEEGIRGVEVIETDYRDLRGHFDKIVSIEMIEAVGLDRLGTYFRSLSGLLKADGVALIQGITLRDDYFEQYRQSVDFIQKYIFPGSCLLSWEQVQREVERVDDLRVVHLEEIGPHYVGTLQAWRSRFFEKIEEVRRLGYPERFLRMWNYYFAYCEAGFQERFVGDIQFAVAKPGWRGSVSLAPVPAVW